MVKPALFQDGDFSEVERKSAEAAQMVREIRGL